MEKSPKILNVDKKKIFALTKGGEQYGRKPRQPLIMKIVGASHGSNARNWSIKTLSQLQNRGNACKKKYLYETLGEPSV